jgi:hypothetical protein
MYFEIGALGCAKFNFAIRWPIILPTPAGPLKFFPPISATAPITEIELKMNDTHSAVTRQAGALLEAWRGGTFPTQTTVSRSSEPSLFEAERQELLQAVVSRMNENGAPATRPVRGQDPKVEACLSILRHLGARPSAW